MLKFKTIPPNNDPVNINKLPNLGILFFFKNWKGYKAKFIVLTLISVIATATGFAGTWLLASIVNNISTVTVSNLLTVFLPGYILIVFISELCGYYTRKYGEMMPLAYTNHLRLRFYNTWLLYQSNKLNNFSKEKLITLSNKYIGYVEAFLADWNWGLPRHIAKVLIIIGILWYQSPVILLINVVYMVGFVALSMYLSRKIIKPIRNYHEAENEKEVISQNFMLNLFGIKKLHKNEFFLNFYKKYIALSNESMQPVRSIHSMRWFLQFNLFNLVFVATFFYGIYQVVKGELPIGYILLIQYAFNNLFGTLIYFVEYYTATINQKQDNLIFKNEIEQLELVNIGGVQLAEIKNINFYRVSVDFGNDKNIHYGEFAIRKKDKIAITGESGSGKSTLVNLLAGQIQHKGTIDVYGDASEIELDLQLWESVNKIDSPRIASVSPNDPLFPQISISENISLDSPYKYMGIYNNSKYQCILSNLKIDEFHINAIEDMSTGQKQRVLLARLLYADADIYILDEPFTGLDEENKKQYMQFVYDFLKDKTVILITHNATEIPANYVRWEMKNNELMKPQ